MSISLVPVQKGLNRYVVQVCDRELALGWSGEEETGRVKASNLDDALTFGWHAGKIPEFRAFLR